MAITKAQGNETLVLHTHHKWRYTMYAQGGQVFHTDSISEEIGIDDPILRNLDSEARSCQAVASREIGGLHSILFGNPSMIGLEGVGGPAGEEDEEDKRWEEAAWDAGKE